MVMDVLIGHEYIKLTGMRYRRHVNDSSRRWISDSRQQQRREQKVSQMIHAELGLETVLGCPFGTCHHAWNIVCYFGLFFFFLCIFQHAASLSLPMDSPPTLVYFFYEPIIKQKGEIYTGVQTRVIRTVTYFF